MELEALRGDSRVGRVFAWGMALATLAVLPALARGSRPTAYEVEAAYLSQFPKFVQWPSDGEKKARPKSVSVCVMGNDPFGRVLDRALADQSANGTPLVARRLRAAGDAANCQVLFVSTSQEDELSTDLSELHGAPVLTVSDIPGFASRGGMIEFVATGNRIRFRINLENTKGAGLSVSSQLLKVALAVVGDGGSRK